MIFYFTGTGNSLYAAQKIAEYNNERIISIPLEMKQKKDSFEYHLAENEIIGFVYPVYAWAPPKMVLDFIDKLSMYDYNNNYIFSVATCGDNIGNTMDVLQRTLKEKHLVLNSGFSIAMPNNYIIIGDVDSKKIEEEKLLKAEEKLQMINKAIKERKRDFFQLEKGPVPFLFTSVINPLFNKHATDATKFYATDVCTSCGLCEKACPTENVSVHQKPVWGSDCTQCLACIHRCPTKAIQYGKGTEKKGRYINPNCKEL